MTIREHLNAKLVENGLWPKEAATVISSYENSGNGKSMLGRWDEDVSGYPVALLATLFLILKDNAVTWLEETKPMHFALHLLKGK